MAGQGEFPSRSFLLYWRAGAVSGFGTYVTLFALQALVLLTLHGSATEVGWLSSVRWLPYLLLGVVVGALVDRRPRLPVMVATDLVQSGLLALIPVLWWLDHLSFPVLLAIVLLYGTAAVVNSAASMSIVPRLVGRADLQRAHAWGDGADAVAMSAGPALAGLLVRVLGAPLAVLVDAASYLYSAVTLGRVQVSEPAATGGARIRDLLREMRDGVRWAYGGSGLTTLAVATHAWFVGNAVLGVVLAPYALLTLGLSAFQLGLTGALGGLGAVAGAAITTRVGLWLGTGRTIILCHALNALGVLVMAAALGTSRAWAAVAVLGLGQVLYGLAMGMSNSHEMSYRQLVTPDELQARTNTTLRSFNRAVMVVVAPVAGVMADAWGNGLALLLAAGVFALVAVGLALTSFRTVRAPL